MKIMSLRYKRTTLLLATCCGILIGIGVSRVMPYVGIFWVVLPLVFTVISYRDKTIVALLFSVLLGLTVGLYRGTSFIANTDNYSELFGKKVILVGHAKSDAVYDNKSQLSFDLGEVQVIEPEEQKLVGVISVSGFGESAVYRGDLVEIEGKLNQTRGSRQARASFAELKVVERSTSRIEVIKREFIAGMYNALPEPEASFGLGLLIGQRSTLPQSVSDTLKVVGLTHIVAVSGYNLTILVRASQRAFGKRSKYQALVASLGLILGFLLITGLSASIVRASIVSILGLFAWYFGRKFRPVLLIMLTASMTALWYPVYVWSDIGWYLSFLAFFGVLVLAPLIILRVWKRKEINGMLQIVVESLCAQIMTAPLIIYIFGQTSLVGLVANVLVVPLVPLGMLFSAIAGVAGWVVPMISGWFAWPANLLLTYMLDVANLLSKVPHALIKVSMGLYGLIVLYAVLLSVCLVLYDKTRGDILTDKEI